MNIHKSQRISRWVYHLIFISTFLFLPVFNSVNARNSEPRPNHADAFTLISIVNNLRTSNGLAPYRIHPTLMGVAQAHSEYMASIRTVTHTGAGGTSYPQRLAGAGYITTFRSENIAGGRGMTEQQVVNLWQGDAPHLHTMLSPDLCEVGAGVAEVDGWIYYTLDTGCSSGSSPPRTTPGTPIPGPTGNPIGVTVIPNTPNSDGMIEHIVQPGETVWSIAIAYETTIDEIRVLNNLGLNPIIFPGNRLIIRSANTPTPITPSPTATLIPTSTQLPTSTKIPSPTPIPTPVKVSPVSPSTSRLYLGGIILFAVVAAIVLAITGSRRSL